jgi:hypothetical protein
MNYENEMNAATPVAAFQNQPNDYYETINDALNIALEEPCLSPQSAMQKVRNVLSNYNIDLPIVFDMDEDGDEYAFKVDNHYLYFIYGRLENGFFEAYSEIAEEARLSELLEEDGEEDID